VRRLSIRCLAERVQCPVYCLSWYMLWRPKELSNVLVNNISWDYATSVADHTPDEAARSGGLYVERKIARSIA
jgi:hypothetical protein